MTLISFKSILFVAFISSGLLGQQQTAIIGLRAICSDTSFVSEGGKSLHFRFIEKEEYGLQIWKKDNSTIYLEWQIEIENWGVDQLFWKDEHTMFLKTLPTALAMRRAVREGRSLGKQRYVAIRLDDR